MLAAIGWSGAQGAEIITSPETAWGVVGRPASYTITSSGAPMSFSAGGLPPGLTLDRASGIISGTPLLVGAQKVVVGAICADGPSEPLTVDFPIYPATGEPPRAARPAVALKLYKSSTVSLRLPTEDNSASYTAVGLPPGVVLESNTGRLVGTPSSVGIFPATLTVTNAYGTDSQPLTITVFQPDWIDLAARQRDADVSCVAFNGSIYAAAREDGWTLTSPDGANWTYGVSLGLSSGPLAIAWGAGQFVMVGRDGKIRTSSDGAAWAAINSPSDKALVGIARSAACFVAVGWSGEIIRSTDGVTWSRRTSGTTKDLYGVAVAGTGFTAVGDGGTILTSADGLSWQKRTSGTSAILHGIAVGGGVQVAVGDNVALTSPNGTTWSQQTRSEELRIVTYGEGKFVAIDADGAVIVSANGAQWSLRPQPDFVAIDLIHDGSRFIAVGEHRAIAASTGGFGTPYVQLTKPGFIFQAESLTLGLVADPAGTLSFGGLPAWLTYDAAAGTLRGTPPVPGTYTFQVCGSNGSGPSEPRIFTLKVLPATGPAPDIRNKTDQVFSIGGQPELGPWATGGGIPIHYEAAGLPPGLGVDPGWGEWTGAATATGLFEAAVTASSFYGTTIQPLRLLVEGGFERYLGTESSVFPTGLTFGNGRWIAVDQHGNIYSAADPKTWQKVYSKSTATFYDAAFGNGRFVVAGENAFMVSDDGVQWRAATAPPAATLWGVTHGGGTFVGYSYPRRIFTSPDGEVWTERDSGLASGSLSSVSHDGTGFYATGAGGVLLYSSDSGATWSSRPTGTTVSLLTMAHGNGAHVMTASGGVVLESSDGLAWTSQTLPIGLGSLSVAFGDGRFFIAGSDGKIHVSSDGQVWEAQADTVSGSACPEVANGLLGTTIFGETVCFVSSRGAGVAPPATQRVSALSGSPFQYTILGRGSPHSFHATNLPPGLLLDSKTGVISGTAGPVTQVTTYNVALAAENTYGIGTVARLPIDVFPPAGQPPVMTNPAWLTASVGSPLGITLYHTGLVSDSTRSVAGLPPGMAWNPAYANITGTPTTPGVYEIQVTATNVYGSRTEPLIVKVDGFASEKGSIAKPLSELVFGNGQFVAAGDKGDIFTSPDGVTWTQRTSPTTSAIYDLAYGNGLYVAVGFLGKIFTSPDGVTWTARTSGTPSDLYGVTFGAGGFVAVGSSGRVATSPDGITWTARTISGSPYFYGVTFGAGLYVARVWSGIMTSPDGITWTAATVPLNSGLYSIVYGGGKFVAVGASGVILTSLDGIAWTSVANTSSETLTGLAYGSGMFIAARSGGGLLVSSDGSSWQSLATGLTSATHLGATAIGDGRVVGVGKAINNPSTTWSAPDLFPPWITSPAASHARAGSPFSHQTATTHRADRFVAYGLPPGLALDGAMGLVSGVPTASGTFTIRLIASNAAGSGPAQNLTLTIYPGVGTAPAWSGPPRATGQVTSPMSVALPVSGKDLSTRFTAAGLPDGFALDPVTGVLSGTPAVTGVYPVQITASNVYGELSGTFDLVVTSGFWKRRAEPLSDSVKSVAFGPGGFRAVRGNSILKSADGVSWAETGALPASSSPSAVVYGNGKWLALKYLGALISSDGETWTSNFISGLYASSGMAFGAGRFVALGSSGDIYESVDGLAWTKRNTGVTVTLNCIAWLNGRFVAFGGSGRVTTSTDGVTWAGSVFDSSNNPSIRSVAYGNGRYVAVGSDYSAALIYTSPDAVTWTRRPYNALIKPLTSILFADGRFVAAGPGGKTYTSPDGLAWQEEATANASEILAMAFGERRVVGVGASGAILSTEPSDPPRITSAAATSAVEEVPFSYAITASGAPASFLASGLPPGLTLDAASGVISGVLPEPGVHEFAVSAEGAGGVAPAVTVTLTVGRRYRIDSAAATAARAGAPFEYQIVAAGNPPSYSATGLPAGLGLDPATGRISGVATTPGNYTITLGAGSATASALPLALSVDVLPAAGTAPTAQAESGALVATGIAFSLPIEIAGLDASSVVSVIGLPAGLSLDLAGGRITGTTSALGVHDVVLEMSNVYSSSTRAIRLVVEPPRWNLQSSGTTRDLLATTWGGGRFLAVEGGSGTTRSALSSADGVAWTSAATGSTNSLFGVAHRGGNYVAVGAGGVIQTSPDGTAWTLRPTGITNWLNAVTDGPAGLVAVGAGSVILRSTDGATWAQSSVSSLGSFGSITASDSTYLALTGASSSTINSTTTYTPSRLCSSPDGAAWTLVSELPFFFSAKVLYANGRLVTVGNGGAIVTSPTGDTWTTRASGTTNHLRAVAHGGGLYVAVGENGCLLTSPNATDWTREPAPTTGHLLGVAYGGGKFVVTGAKGTILTSSSAVPATFTGATAARAVVGAPFTHSLATIGPVSSFSAQGLPPGLALDAATGFISGTPAQPGVWPVLIQGGNASMILQIEVLGSAAPVITAHPTSLTLLVGEDAEFTVTALGENLTYQWSKDGVPLPDAGPTLALRDVTLDSAGWYAAEVRNPAGVAASIPARLVVQETYDDWAASLPAGQRDPAAPNAAGISNFMGYALGWDPLDDSQPLPEASTEQGDLSLIFLRPAWVVGVHYVVETSDSLGAWSSDGVVMRKVAESPLGETWRGAVPMDRPARFLRLRVFEPHAP